MKFNRTELLTRLREHRSNWVLNQENEQQRWETAKRLKREELKRNQEIILANLVGQLSALGASAESRDELLKSKELPTIPKPDEFPVGKSKGYSYRNEYSLSNLIAVLPDDDDLVIRFQRDSTVCRSSEFMWLFNDATSKSVKTRTGWVETDFSVDNPVKQYPSAELGALDKLILLLETAEDEFITSTGIEQLGMLPTLRRWVQ